MRRAAGAPALLALALGTACFAGGAQLSASGKGLPVVTVDFPARAAPGSVHTSTVEVRNPGPGDIERLVVAFARVGAPSSEGLPTPIVGGGRRSGGVLAVTPRPASVTADGTVYRFGRLAAGDSAAIEFRLRMPSEPGPAANSVTVYDDVEPDRARGARLGATVEG